MTDNVVSEPEAVRILSQGGIVIFPTDTAFGIGCRMDNPESVDRVFRLRRRPAHMPTPVLVDSSDMALRYLATPPPVVGRLMERYWPGGLTIIARCNTDRVYGAVRGNTDTLGVRMPDHESARTLIRGTGVPILGPSANFHGKPTPFRADMLDPELVRLVDAVVTGTCTAGEASTVVDTTKFPPVLIRQGAVKLTQEDFI